SQSLAASRSHSRVQLECSQSNDAGYSVVISRRRNFRNGSHFFAPLTSKRISRDARISAMPRLRPYVGGDSDFASMGCASVAAVRRATWEAGFKLGAGSFIAT